MVLAVSVIGCATNGFQTYYQPNRENVANRLLPWSGRVRILEPADIRESGDDFYRLGYLPLGSSSFSSGESVTMDQLLETATLVRADIVLYYSEHLGSRTVSSTRR